MLLNHTLRREQLPRNFERVVSLILSLCSFVFQFVSIHYDYGMLIIVIPFSSLRPLNHEMDSCK